MKFFPDECLMNYEFGCMEFHAESTDFEDQRGLIRVASKKGNHNILNTKHKASPNKDKIEIEFQNNMYSITSDSSKELWESETIISHNGTEIDLAVHHNYKNIKSKILDSGDQIQTIKSKRSLIRHRVMPCLSSMFGRTSNNVKQMSIIKENQPENVRIDSGCQASPVKCRHRLKKFNRRQHCYAVQPVYGNEGNIYRDFIPCQETKIDRELSPSGLPEQTIHDCSNAHHSLTSSGVQEYDTRLDDVKMIKKSDVQEQNQWLQNVKHKGQQKGTTKFKKNHPFQIYTVQGENRVDTGISPKCSMCRHPSSGFWDYLINKMTMTYQAHQNKHPQPCRCKGPSQASGSQLEPACNPNKSQFCEFPPQEVCACSPSSNCHQKASKAITPKPPAQAKIRKPEKVQCGCRHVTPQTKSKPTTPISQTAESTPSTSPEDEIKPCQMTHEEVVKTLAHMYNGEILCIHNPPCILINGCLNIPTDATKEDTMAWPILTQNNTSVYHQEVFKKTSKQKSASCQYYVPSTEIKHNEICDEACQYNPSVMCAEINPTYSLIDRYSQCCSTTQFSIGLVSVEQPSSPKRTSVDQVSDCQCSNSPIKVSADQMNYSPKHMSVDQVYNGQLCYSPRQVILGQSMEETRGYQFPLLESYQSQFPNKGNKQEKIVQSICNHNPPCEVIRSCCRPKLDPNLQTSCVHVPMCENVPLCMMGKRSRDQTITACGHTPRCAEVPICTRNYILLTAREEIGTQVRPKAKMVCRHQPPCIMIPSCLAKVLCDGLIPCDAIPDCIHQPMCDMIPACCRKSAKDMESRSSQVYDKSSSMKCRNKWWKVNKSVK